MKNIRLAVVGATGLVGQTILKVLEEKKLPITSYTFFASSRSSGKKIIFQNAEYTVQELTSSSFNQGFDFAIFSAGGDVSKKFAPIASKSGCIVIDNSNYFRMEPEVPLIVPEVNPEEIQNHHGIIANPNCSTIQAVVCLKPLDQKYGLERVVYNTYQAVSGSGYKGVLDLENGAKNFANSGILQTNYELQKFPCSIFSNCLPHIDVFLQNSYTKEEEKMINETRKILNIPNLKVTATAVRVPVFNSHSESIQVELKNDFDLQELKHLLENSPGIIVKDDSTNSIYPTTLDTSGQDNVFVGRIRRDDSVKFGIHLWVVADNLRKGAASNSVQILEKLILKK